MSGVIRPAVPVLTALALGGCTAVQLAGDVIEAGQNVNTAVQTTSDASDLIDRQETLGLYYRQRAAGDWPAALTTISELIDAPVTDDHRFLTRSWNADIRAQALNTLRNYVERVRCDEGFPDTADQWFDTGKAYASDEAPQTVKTLTIEHREFEAVYADKCIG